jgi:hypothetical protein
MVVVKRRALLLAALAAFACTAPDTPTDAIVTYFRALGRDPIRTLPITTEAFHRAHGLMLASTTARPESADREQVAWLAVQRQPEFAELAASLVASIVRADERGDAASVVVRVEAPGKPPFEQRFDLIRDAQAGWRIDAVTQTGVSDAALSAAFAAHPSSATQRRIEALDKRGRAWPAERPRAQPTP